MAHILVVDDEWRIREMLRMLLEDVGHSVTTTAEGHAALREIEANGLPDLIVLDLSMPEMDGWRVLDELYRSNRRDQTRVLVVTGLTNTPSTSPDALRKPFAAADLYAAVDRAFSETTHEAVARRRRLRGLCAVLRPSLPTGA